MVIKGTSNEATLLVVAKKMDIEYLKFNELADWNHRICGTKAAKKPRKA